MENTNLLSLEILKATPLLHTIILTALVITSSAPPSATQSHSSARVLPRYDQSPLRPSRYHENRAQAHRETTVSLALP
ncbi:hypothetical protein BDN70DRAFT_586754 [Pholiota conissans]|uniref:Uncharacterized protein n=1 Tax=Pholiota conissans TaxID=109636 RepID=A0A9P6CM18_9AGAR|nr:hypothetical protein BDN70DRAFT_586754 [Pholiota conissans]